MSNELPLGDPHRRHDARRAVPWHPRARSPDSPAEPPRRCRGRCGRSLRMRRSPIASRAARSSIPASARAVSTWRSSRSWLRLDANLGDGEVGTLHMNLSAQRATHRLHRHAGRRRDPCAECADWVCCRSTCPRSTAPPDTSRTDLRVGGTLGAPTLAGIVKVSGGEIDVYQVNLVLRQIEVEARLDDAGLNFKGSAHVGNGTVTPTATSSGATCCPTASSTSRARTCAWPTFPRPRSTPPRTSTSW